MTSKDILLMIIVAVAVAIGLGAIVIGHDQVELPVDEPAVADSFIRAKVQGAGPMRIGSTRAAGGGRGMSTSDSLEHRLRLYSRAGVLQRAAIVHSIRQSIGEFEPHILKILAAEPEGLIVPAVRITGRLEFESGKLPLYSLLDSLEPVVRAAAVRAIGDRGLWDAASLRRILEQERDPNTLIAAIDVCQRLQEPPIRTLVSLLSHPDWAIVKAARRALPSRLDKRGLETMNEFIRTSSPAAAVVGVKVLGSLDRGRDRDAALLEHIASPMWVVQMASLKALIADGGQIKDVANIWKIIEDDKASVPMRTFAFLVLEKTRSFDDARTLRTLERLHPVIQLAAARCLVTNKNRAGARVLISLLSTKVSPTVSSDDRACATQSAYEVLKEISERIYDPVPEPWLRWHRRQEPLPGKALTVLPRLSW